MYKGRRDPEIRIVVEQKHCDKYKDKAGILWTEIFIPPESVTDYDSQWGSMMVDRHQVDNLGSTNPYNVVRVNDDADITVSIKDTNHNVISYETLKPREIIGRLLKYYRYKTYHSDEYFPVTGDDIESFELYKDMHRLGQEMMYYVNRLPKVIDL